MKKFIALILSLVLVMTFFTACGSEPKEPVYTSNEKFDIGTWVGINHTFNTFTEEGKLTGKKVLTDDELDAMYKELAESGINIASPGNIWDRKNPDNFNIKTLMLCKKYGIQQILFDSDIQNFLLNALSQSEIKSEAQLVEELKTLLKPYVECEYADALYGFWLIDEPNVSKYDQLGFAQKIFKQACPDKVLYLNLFPVYGGSLLGTNYTDYIAQYLKKFNNDYISYDNYVIKGDGFKTWIGNTYLYNMMVVKKQLLQEVKDGLRETPRKFWAFVQSQAFAPENRKIESQADIDFQTNAFLAFGVDGLQWFTYCTPNTGDTDPYYNAMISLTLQKTPVYYYVQKNSADLQYLMPWYKNFTWKGIMLSDIRQEDSFSYLIDDEYTYTEHETLTKFKSSDDAFCGLFKDKDGNDGFMFVNYTDPALKVENTLELKFNGYSRAVVIKNGAKEIVKLNGGNCELTLLAGEGAFVIPYK